MQIQVLRLVDLHKLIQRPLVVGHALRSLIDSLSHYFIRAHTSLGWPLRPLDALLVVKLALVLNGDVVLILVCLLRIQCEHRAGRLASKALQFLHELDLLAAFAHLVQCLE